MLVAMMELFLLFIFSPIAEAHPTPEKANLGKRTDRHVDQGNLMCLSENYPMPQGDPRYFMTLDEANKAASAACIGWTLSELNPGANPGFDNVIYVLDDNSDPSSTNITVSVTYKGGKNCPKPPLNFWYDRNLPGDGATHCSERLGTIVNGCDLQQEAKYWKQGGSFYRDCVSWTLWKSLTWR